MAAPTRSLQKEESDPDDTESRPLASDKLGTSDDVKKKKRSRRIRLRNARMRRWDQCLARLKRKEAELKYLTRTEEPKTKGASSCAPTRLPNKPESPKPSSSSVVVDVRPRQSLRHEDQASAAVKKEARVLSRIRELQQEGLWSDKKVPKGPPEPPVARAHWSFVLEEMTWLWSVFQNEVKTKKANAKRCARAVQRHFAERAQLVAREEREREQNRRRIASFVAREVRTFWSNAEKLFEFGVRSQIERKRKRALDEHLDFIVGRTEKYSTLLAESLQPVSSSQKTTPYASDVESVSSGSRKANDRDYCPEESSDDDEATIAKEEDGHDEGEIDELNQEAEIPLEELLRKFHPELYDGEDKSESGDVLKNGEKDTESNISKESESQSSKTKEDSSRSSLPKERSQRHSEQVSDDEGESKPVEKSEDDEEEKEREDNLKALVEEDPELFDAVETAEAFQPTGNTLDTTTVKTPVPFLLKHSLREYQHIGLDWLVSLHERSFNGILADEMGLGKTIQTIALLAHLACARGIWGPHLIVVPTSVMLNWEMELKKWCPAFKVLTYYGSQKERKAKRVGWTKPNAFHVCITSYKLVIQDHQSFRRKQWYYFILDEAQHIKNFKSQRWQLLLNFSSCGRLLLTGTPLQNNLMELWSLMHFLMPNVFQSHRNFKEWFSNPLTGMVEDTQEYNEGLVRRLHKVLRPFLLRRLKNEVEKQLPKKYEHVVYCSLSKRQRYLYDDFMSRAKTRETLAGGNFMSVINVLMQLRKVCNHPNLFEARATLSPFVCEPLTLQMPQMVFNLTNKHPLECVDMKHHPMNLLTHELTMSAFAAHSVHRLLLQRHHQYQQQRQKQVPQKQLQPQQPSVRAVAAYHPPPACPSGKFRMTIRYNSTPLATAAEYIPFSTIVNNNIYIKKKSDVNIRTDKGTFLLTPYSYRPSTPPLEPADNFNGHQSDENGDSSSSLLDKENHSTEISPPPPKRKRSHSNVEGNSAEDKRKGIFCSEIFKSPPRVPSTLAEDSERLTRESIESLMRQNRFKTDASPLYGTDFVRALTFKDPQSPSNHFLTPFNTPTHEDPYDRTVFSVGLLPATAKKDCELGTMAKDFVGRFHMFVPPVLSSFKEKRLEIPPASRTELALARSALDKVTFLEMSLQLPEARLIQYDCGKLQVSRPLQRRTRPICKLCDPAHACRGSRS